ncbi:carbohydrate kinase family protein [Treponema sp. TIM-1]|uniref:carbohydrate kinase family protein n=1 Tax=Treponema sp. TIM-1 TaxID=2898417 RepID=UPI0039808659
MIIHGTGCCLLDALYRADFSGPAFQAALSRREGDGGLTPGRLVFAENFERFMGKPYEEALGALIEGKGSDSQNLGGPSVVSLAHVAQVRSGGEVCFFGVRGNDETGLLVEKALARLPFKKCRLSIREGATPRTDVLSDPHYDNGHGERTFINLLGAASRFDPPDLGVSFFEADIVAFGGTALVPALHDGLTELLKQAKGAVTVVNLVYDYRSEYAAPGKKWKLGIRDDAYPYIDLLIADRDEVLKTSGQGSPEEAAAWLLSRGVGAVVITEGARPIRLTAGKGLFAPRELTAMPVCELINQELALHREFPGDTTGCGDNFAGGIIAGIAEQLGSLPRGSLDLREACIPAVAAGGFACFTVGGTYYESHPGEKQKRLESYIKAYRKQLGG